MQTPPLAEYFQRVGIDRYPALAPFVPLDKKPFKSKVQKPSLCVHNQWYGPPHEPGSGKRYRRWGLPHITPTWARPPRRGQSCCTLKAQMIEQGESVEFWRDWKAEIILSPWETGEYFEEMALEQQAEAKRLRALAIEYGVQNEELVQALKLTRENFRACQGTIHLAGGFDPAYANDAQRAMKIADCRCRHSQSNRLTPPPSATTRGMEQDAHGQ